LTPGLAWDRFGFEIPVLLRCCWREVRAWEACGRAFASSAGAGPGCPRGGGWFCGCCWRVCGCPARPTRCGRRARLMRWVGVWARSPTTTARTGGTG